MKKNNGIKRWELFASVVFALLALFFFAGILFVLITKIFFGDGTIEQ